MNEENFMDSSNDQENDENYIDKENFKNEYVSDDENEEQRLIFEQQQFQRQQFYERQSHQMNIKEENLSNDSQDENINQEDDDDVSIKNEPVTEFMIEKIDSEKWPGVNGHYDGQGEWKEWHEMSSSINTYSGDIVNILPYVNISC